MSSSGELGGFGSGIHLKKALLAHERESAGGEGG
ncbi:MAG: hypothetical protein V3V56_09415 [bacterium]